MGKVSIMQDVLTEENSAIESYGKSLPGYVLHINESEKVSVGDNYSYDVLIQINTGTDTDVILAEGVITSDHEKNFISFPTEAGAALSGKQKSDVEHGVNSIVTLLHNNNKGNTGVMISGWRGDESKFGTFSVNIVSNENASGFVSFMKSKDEKGKYKAASDNDANSNQPGRETTISLNIGKGGLDGVLSYMMSSHESITSRLKTLDAGRPSHNKDHKRTGRGE